MIAAITAGGCIDGAFAAEIGTAIKALAPLGDGRLIDRSIRAARDCGVDRIVVIGNEEVRRHCGASVDTILAAVADGRENLHRALQAAGENDLLFLTSDLPFVTGAAIADFLERRYGADLAMPLATDAAYRLEYADAQNRATSIGAERVVNGSVFYFARGVAAQVDAIAQRFFEARKSLVRMAAIAGPALLLKFATRRLQIADVEARAKHVLGVRALAVRHAAPSLCYDVDTIEDYRYAIGRLRDR